MDDLKARYLLETRLSDGSPGVGAEPAPALEAWPGRSRQTGRRVVVELGPPGLDEAAAQRTAQALARLQRCRDPGLRRVVEVGHEAGRNFIVLEPAARKTKADERVPPERILAVARRLAGGLAAVHAAGFVHGHFGSEHVEWTASGEPRLTLSGLLGTGHDESAEAVERDVAGLLAQLRLWGADGNGVVPQALEEHPEGRPYRTAAELLSVLGPSVGQRGPRTAHGLAVVGLALFGLLLTTWTGGGERAANLVRDVVRSRPPEPAAPPPLLDEGRRAARGAARGAGRGTGRGAGRGAGASHDPAPGASTPVGTWRCTVRERPLETPLLTIVPGGGFHMEVDAGRSRQCDGAWKALGRDRFRLSGVCAVIKRKGPKPGQPFQVTLQMTGPRALTAGGAHKPGRWDCKPVA